MAYLTYCAVTSTRMKLSTFIMLMIMPALAMILITYIPYFDIILGADAEPVIVEENTTNTTAPITKQTDVPARTEMPVGLTALNTETLDTSDLENI